MSSENESNEGNELSDSNFTLGLEADMERSRRYTPSQRRDIDTEYDKFINRYDNGKYRKQIYEIIQENKESIIIDFNDIMDCSTVLWELYVNDPKMFISRFKQKLYALDFNNDYFKPENYFNVRMINHYLREKISNVSVKHNNKLVSMRGRISKLSEKKPYIYQFHMRCTHCDFEVYSDHKEGSCPNCEDGPRLVNDRDRNVYTNCYYIKIQELNEDLDGQVPMQMECIILGDVTDRIRAGMKINCTAFIFLREITSTMSERTPFVLSAVANNITPLLSNDLENIEKAKITEQDEAKILALVADKPNLIKTLVNSFCPQILGLEQVKLGVMLSIVGAGKMHVDGVTIRTRMHDMLIGDPGTGKTEILSFGEKITLGSIKASAKGVSGGGLTAVTLKERDGSFSIQPGALIFANGSVLWFDEADKTDNEVRAHLHESMESGTVTIMKGGQMATLQAETTVVFGANPRFSRYDDSISVAENINLPESLISRFDLIFIIKDVVNEERDRSISRHIDSIFVDRKVPTYGNNNLSILDLIKYITYVKKQDIDPIITNGALKLFEDYYVQIRNKSTSETISITPRQKQGMLRLIRALGRLTLTKYVDKFEADIIIKLMDYEIKNVYTDKDGNINIAEAEGKTLAKLKGSKLMIEILKQLEKSYDRDKIPKKQIRALLSNEYKMDETKVEKFLLEMSDTGIIQHTSEGYVRRATDD